MIASPHIPRCLRRKAKRQVKVPTEVLKYILYTALGASLAIALQVKAEPTQLVVEESQIIDTKTATVTAYTSSPDETDEDPFIAANGETVHRGMIACPSKYAFGTKVEIAGKVYECKDRMNKRYRNSERFDIWMPSKAEAKKFGVQTLTVEIIDTDHVHQ